MASFLGLPGELRNRIYEFVADDLTTTRRISVTPNITVYVASQKWPPYEDQQRHLHPVSKHITSHPLLGVCHQVRSEFASFLSTYGGGKPIRTFHVTDYKFEHVLRCLQFYPSTAEVGDVLIMFHLTEPGAEDWNQLRNWVIEATPAAPPAAPGIFMINSTAYRIQVVISPGSLHHRRDSYRNAHWCKFHRQHVHPIVPKACRQMMDLIGDIMDTWRLIGRYRSSSRFKYHHPRIANRKRLTTTNDRQAKRRKLIEEGEWEVAEGYDVFGNRDEEYKRMVEAFGALKIHGDEGNSFKKLKCNLNRKQIGTSAESFAEIA